MAKQQLKKEDEEELIENEDEFLDRCYDAMKKLISELDKLEFRSLEKAQCISKALELAFWIKQYQYEKGKAEELGDDYEA